MIFPGLLGIMTGQIWRCIEVVVTRLTRNQLTGNTVRGFESLHLRQKHKGLPVGRSLVLWMKVPRDLNPRALGNVPGARFNPRRHAPQGRSNPSISAMASEQATYRLLRFLCLRQKNQSSLIPLLLLSNPKPSGFGFVWRLRSRQSPLCDRTFYFTGNRKHHPLRSLDPPCPNQTYYVGL